MQAQQSNVALLASIHRQTVGSLNRDTVETKQPALHRHRQEVLDSELGNDLSYSTISTHITSNFTKELVDRWIANDDIETTAGYS